MEFTAKGHSVCTTLLFVLHPPTREKKCNTHKNPSTKNKKMEKKQPKNSKKPTKNTSPHATSKICTCKQKKVSTQPHRRQSCQQHGGLHTVFGNAVLSVLPPSSPFSTSDLDVRVTTHRVSHAVIGHVTLLVSVHSRPTRQRPLSPSPLLASRRRPSLLPGANTRITRTAKAAFSEASPPLSQFDALFSAETDCCTPTPFHR